MSSMSFPDKLRVILDLTTSSALFIGIVLFMILITYLLITTSDKNIKKKRKFYITIYIIVLGLIIFFYHSSLLKIFDSMIDNIFMILYFPNIAAYLFAMIVTNIILWTSILNVKINKVVKVVDCCIFTILHYLLILILNIISTNKLDVFNQTELYSNNDIVALIELSSSLFTIWIIFLIVYNLFLNYLTKQKQPLKVKTEVKEIIKEVTKEPLLPKNITVIPAPLVAEIPVTIKENNTNIYDQMLSLDDYKIVIDILKKQRSNKKEIIKTPEITEIDSILNNSNLSTIESIENKPVIENLITEETININQNKENEIELETTLKNITANTNSTNTSIIEVTQQIPVIINNETTELERLPDITEELEPRIIPIIENKNKTDTKKAEHSKFLELQALYKNI